MTTGERIEMLKGRLGLSYQDLADAAKVSDETVSRWCKGEVKKGPSLDQAIKLAKRLGTTVEYLATGRQPMPTELTEDEMIVLQVYRDLGLGRAEAVRGLTAAAREGGPAPSDPYPVDVPGRTERPPGPERKTG